jgi:hypothetical protein
MIEPLTRIDPVNSAVPTYGNGLAAGAYDALKAYEALVDEVATSAFEAYDALVAVSAYDAVAGVPPPLPLAIDSLK